jgi:Uma2 family endonuclease
MSAPPKHRWTPEEYLAFEQQSDTKHEYVDGEIYDMVGGSPRHNQISANVIRLLGNALNDSPCIVYSSDQSVRAKSTGNYFSPDVSVTCTAPLHQDNVLLNPTLIVEVLSPSTENYDRIEKFENYRRIQSLQAYLKITQDNPRIEYYLRQGEQWLIGDAVGLDAVVEISAISCTLPLAGIYNKVSFDPDESA